jgi:hypothetical protein
MHAITGPFPVSETGSAGVAAAWRSEVGSFCSQLFERGASPVTLTSRMLSRRRARPTDWDWFD